MNFQKAFDSIEWKCIYRDLKKFNIGNDYIKWIKTLYYKPKITIKNNGWLTDYIELQRSERQGCSVSALLFILVRLYVNCSLSLEAVNCTTDVAPTHTQVTSSTSGSPSETVTLIKT